MFFSVGTRNNIIKTTVVKKTEGCKLQQMKSAEQVALFKKQLAFIGTVPQRFHMIKQQPDSDYKSTFEDIIAVAPQDWS